MTTSEYDALLRKLTPDAEARLRSRHKLTNEDVEDVLQIGMIELVRAMERGNVLNPGGLLTTILDRRAADRVRLNKLRLSHEAPAGLDPAEVTSIDPVLPPDADRNIFATEHDRAIRGMATAERETYILVDLRGLTLQQAAEFLALPKSTVQSRLERARAAVRKETT
jgi:RNA polymerase sigma-70 factor (ECF subfamily)